MIKNMKVNYWIVILTNCCFNLRFRFTLSSHFQDPQFFTKNGRIPGGSSGAKRIPRTPRRSLMNRWPRSKRMSQTTLTRMVSLIRLAPMRRTMTFGTCATSLRHLAGFSNELFSIGIPFHWVFFGLTG